jgi:ADP-ribose pyrophosphatase YjhB (NUDIX family)
VDVREIAEVASLRFEPEGIVRIGETPKDDRHTVYITVTGTVDGRLVAPADDPKISEVRWVTVGEAQALVPDFDDDFRARLAAPAIDYVFEASESP